MADFDFSAVPVNVNFTCAKCGAQDRGPEGAAMCCECRHYEENPKEAPGYFTWTKTADGWAAKTWLKDTDPAPEPGTEITVHRRERHLHHPGRSAKSGASTTTTPDTGSSPWTSQGFRSKGGSP